MDHRQRCFRVLLLILALKYLHKKRRPRRFWVRPSLILKRTGNILMYRRMDDYDLTSEEIIRRGYFKTFTRMPFEIFSILYHKVKDNIQKRVTRMRLPITPLARLTVTMRFLATGDSFDSLESVFNISKSAISKIIRETCKVIIMALCEYIKTPNSEEDWEKIAQRFYERWNFPHCLGAIDGKHCPVIQPKFTGSEFYNYKNFFSIVLFGIADADFKFIYIDVGAQGKASDGGVFHECSFRRDWDAGKIGIPKARPLQGRTKLSPYVLVADDAFPLTNHLMKPYPGEYALDSAERKFNQRCSRARARIENTFGILSSRFRVLKKPMSLKTYTATLVIMATCYLHNFIKTHIAEEEDEVHQEIMAAARTRIHEIQIRQEHQFPTVIMLKHFVTCAKLRVKRVKKQRQFVKNFICDWFGSDAGTIPFPVRDW